MTRRSLDVGDSAALQAALSLLDDMSDDHDVDDLFLGSPDSSGDASVEDSISETVVNNQEIPATGASRPTRKRQRNRRKDEIAYLRNKVAALERELEATNERLAKAQGAPEIISIWREVATRQRRTRRASEAQNAALREMLKRQVQVARQLLQFLEMQPNEEDIPGVRALKRLQLAALDVTEFDHDDLLRRMDALYAQAHSVFDADSSWTSRRTLQSVHVRDTDGEDDEAVMVEIRTAWVVPFELGVVAKVLRERSDRTTIQAQCDDFQTLEEKDRLLVSLFSGGTKYENGEPHMEFRGRVVSRYYPEPADARVVIVSELSVEPVVSPEANAPMYAVQSQGWIRLQPYRLNGESLRSATTQSLTQIQWFRTVKILPRSLDGPGRHPKAGMFTEIVLTHIQRDLDESQQVIEDLLLEGNALPALDDPQPATSTEWTESTTNGSLLEQDHDQRR